MLIRLYRGALAITHTMITFHVSTIATENSSHSRLYNSTVFVTSHFSSNNRRRNMASVMTRVEFIPTSRGGRKLVINGYSYRINRKTTDKSWWKCAVKGCSSGACTVDDRLTGPLKEHTHPPCHSNPQVQLVMNSIRKRAREETTAIPTIYTEEISKLRSDETRPISDDIARNFPGFSSVKSGLYKQRQNTIPALPKNTSDVHLTGVWTQTKSGEDFMLVNDGEEDKIILFATEKNLRNLCDADKIFCDGTFYSSPHQFKQIYTLHAFVEGQMFPLVFGLLPNKSQATYTRMFELLKEVASSKGLTLNPPSVQLDFELAVHNAASQVFPGVELKGCFFHYTQCIWRKVQQLGLTTTYQTDSELYRFVRRAAVLPLVPVEHVEDVWLQALEESPDNTKAQSLADYVTETWIEGPFDQVMWNHFRTSGPRTTNHLEGWHNKLNRLIQKAHPNVFQFLSVIQTEQAANEIKMLQLEGGIAPPQKRRKYRNVDHRLSTLKEQLTDGRKTVIEYADSASYLLAL